MADDNGTSNAGGTANDGGGQTVPIAEVTQMRDEVRELKQTIELQTDQIQLYRANQQQTTQQTTQGSEPSVEGLADDDVITVADMKKIMAGQDAKITNALTQIQSQSEHSDFNVVINKYVPILAKERPDLAQAMSTSQNPGLLAYEACKQLPQYERDQAEAKLAKDATGKTTDKTAELSPEAKKILENQAKPGAASGAAAGGGGDSSVQHYAQMSDNDLDAKIEEVKGRG